MSVIEELSYLLIYVVRFTEGGERKAQELCSRCVELLDAHGIEVEVAGEAGADHCERCDYATPAGARRREREHSQRMIAALMFEPPDARPFDEIILDPPTLHVCQRAVSFDLMNRAQILSRFDVDEHGIIQTPGEFFGQMLYVPYLWSDAVECGQVPDEGRRRLTFIPTARDRAEFPELRDKRTVALDVENGEFRGEAKIP